MDLVARLLSVYVWALAGILVLLLFGIGRFYQQTTKENSHYKLFLLPVALYWVGAALYTPLEPGNIGTLVGDVLFCLGGLAIFGLGFRLVTLMTGRH